MEITQFEYVNMLEKFWNIKEGLPPHLQRMIPEYHIFLSPVGLIKVNRDTYELSITGAKRWQLLNSPHAAMLLRVHAIKQLERKAWFDKNPAANWWKCPHDA